MRCLTPAEVSSWLATHELPADPYHPPGRAPSCHLQRAIPRESTLVGSFTRAALAEITGGQPVLVLMTKWPHDQPDQMQDIRTIRRSCGEVRPLIEAPGHLLDPTDGEMATELFSLATAHEWTCWVHTPGSGDILLTWEGELIDYWTEDPERFARVEELAEAHGFTEPLPPA
ncbi:MAG: hypothetical protein EOP88_14290 [Verrucomicrobiaceae bacterium]|nr:MAG: hypothetical protein EOP88_14290 [Verrucomicrobiaceae bacterium]